MSKIISRKEALAKRLKRYFTGKPCKWGHICEKTINGQCTECIKTFYLNPVKKKLILFRNTRYNSSERGAFKRRAAAKLRYKKDQGSQRFIANSRQKRTVRATPKWENNDFTKKIYKIASDIQKKTGVKMDVDHIIPLGADIVCGLNVWYNLTIIPHYINGLKGKKVLTEIADHVANKDDWMEYIDGKYSFLCKTFPNQERFDLYIEKQKELYELIVDTKNHKKNSIYNKMYLMFQTSSGGGKTFNNYLRCLPISY